MTPPASPGSSPLLQPLPKPPGRAEAEDPVRIRPVLPVREDNVGSSVNRGPKKETARISILPRPTAPTAPTINMTKTQPLLIHPAGATPSAPVVITSKPVAPVDAISRSLGWALLAVSAMIFLIQIWNYVVS